jgi:TPR repeat protein
LRSVCAVRLLLAALAVATGAAAPADEWVQAKSPHFTVYSDAGDLTARRVAWEFEQVRAILGRQWPWARLDSGQAIVILAARDEASLKILLPSFWETKGRARPAGLFVRGIDTHQVALRADAPVTPGPRAIAYFENPYHVIFHEYVHFVLSLNFGAIPLWFNEGLAEYFGDVRVEGSSIDVGKPIPGHIALLRQRAPLPISTLLTVDTKSPHYGEENKATIFYAQSWALVHYLIYGGEGSASLNRFASLLKQGVDPSEAASQALPPRDELGQKLDRYIRQAVFHYRRLPAPVPEAAQRDCVSRTVSRAEALAVRGDLQLHLRRFAAARRLLEEALRLDADLALAHRCLGLLAFLDDTPERGRDHVAKALELAPDSFLTQFMNARLLWVPGASPADLERAEAGFLRAAKLNTDFAPTYAALSAVSAQRGAPIESTEPVARRAISLEPGNSSYHLNLALLMFFGGKVGAARDEAYKGLELARNDQERLAAQQVFDRFATASAGKVVGPVAPSAIAAGGAFEIACAAGDPYACHQMAQAFESGGALERNEERARQFHEKGCDLMEAESCARLGEIYEQGEGVTRDLVQARTFYKRSCDGGYAAACESLKALAR